MVYINGLIRLFVVGYFILYFNFLVKNFADKNKLCIFDT